MVLKIHLELGQRIAEQTPDPGTLDLDLAFGR